MGFNNGYDAGWEDAIAAVRNGQVAGLGPVTAAPAETDTPATSTFDAGVLEGYDVEKLLSDTDRSGYLDSLTDAELAHLIDTNDSLLSPLWGTMLHDNMPDSRSKLASILYSVLTKIEARGLIESSGE